MTCDCFSSIDVIGKCDSTQRVATIASPSATVGQALRSLSA